MSNLDDRQYIVQLTPEERVALFEQLNKKKKERHLTTTKSIPRQSRESRLFPLSFAQQRLWFLDQLEPNTSLYTMAQALHIQGDVSRNALRYSLESIIARHEILRTTYVAIDGEPMQVIAEEAALSIPLIDLRGLPPTDRESEALHIAASESQHPFDLLHGPVLRVKVVQLAEQEHILLLTMHHIASDGWSQSVFTQELVALYSAYLNDEPAALAELPIQYIDFALWQRQKLQGKVMEELLGYWKRQLADLPMLQLPTDHPRPAIRSVHGAIVAKMLPFPLFERLSMVSRQEDVSLFMLLLAAFAVLLARYTGGNDIPVGTSIANRNRAEIEGLIGFFVNTLVMRINVAADLSFRELVKQVREVCLEAYAHQDLPFERLVDAMQPERDLSVANPLVQVTFVLQNTPKTDLELPGLSLQPLVIDTRTAKFDLSMFVMGNEQKMFLEIEYNRDLFEEATVIRMLEHYMTILRAIAVNLQQPLASLALLTPTEQRQLLVEWNDTSTYPVSEACLHHLFEAQAQRTPDAIAMALEEEQISYHELNARANQLAHFLQARGVGPEKRVGLYMERSLELILCLLGILKAGGAYIPLDPAYPGTRLAFMLEDSQVPIILTRADLAPNLPALQAEVVEIEATWEHLGSYRGDNASSAVTANHLAYVIYTSGSTGEPKGVMVEHQAVCNHMQWIQQRFTLTPADRVLQKTVLSFDASVWEIFAPLQAGAQLVLAQPGGHKDSAYLVETIANQDITVLQLAPTMLHLLLDEPTAQHDNLHSLRSVFCGGEALSLQLQQKFFARCQAALHNLYGPTEAAIDVTYWPCQRESELDIVPIGSPITNIQIYLLDALGRPVPIGVAGELYIGGIGLARGYFDRPDLTAERFVPNPFSRVPGARLYKTGDLARYLSSGAIAYLGRNDQQVKIRGNRIELKEIEATLQQHPAVYEAVVAQRLSQHDENSNDKQLIAYVVRKQHHRNSEQETPVEWSTEQIAHWQQVFDISYREADKPREPTFNFVGWKSSYTGQPIPEEEMREWLNATIERILSLQPKRVLEIGCGTGLLLSHIAPTCEEYWGTDFSPAVIDALRTLLSEQGIANVRLLQRNADDFSGELARQQGFFDVVILNSVIQYFPSVEYLLSVLERAVHLLAPGGFIFVGDVRNLELLEIFHTSVQMRQAPLSLLTKQVQALIQKRLANENELVVDPSFFFTLYQRLPRISNVELQLKRGRHHNELTRFRYDVVLHVECGLQAITEYIELDWQKKRLTLPMVQHILETQQPDVLFVTHVPNARLVPDMKVLSLLHSDAAPDRVGAIWEAVRNSTEESGIDPEDFWCLADILPYAVSVTQSEPDSVGCYDVLLMQHKMRSKDLGRPLLTISQRKASEQVEPWQKYANQPFQAEHTNSLVPELRDYLKQRLPDYMMPTVIMQLQALPLLPNGKLDYKALPAPDGSRPHLKNAFVAPRTINEKRLAEIWSQVLGIEQIGIHDNFFELGGDSLMTIRVVTKASQIGLGITVKQLFQHQTIAELISAVNSTHVLAEQGLVTGPMPIMPAHRMSLAVGMGDPSCHSMAYIVEAAEPLDAILVKKVVKHVLMYHDALRLRAIKREDGWELYNEGLDERLPFRQIDLSHLLEVEQMAEIMNQAINIVMHFDLAKEPLLRVALCYLGPHRPTPLIVVGHSLVVDMQSWQMLLEDFKTAYRQLRDQRIIHFPPKTTSYKQWADRLVEYGQSTQIQEELSYWLSDARRCVRPLPMDYPAGVNDGASTQILLAMLSTEETAALKRLVARLSGLQMDAVLLTAIARVFTRWSGQQSLHVTFEGYGREPIFEDIDLSHTLGTLAMDFPLLLNLDEGASTQEALQMMHEQLHQVPHRGLSYSVLRYMNNDRAIVEQLEALPQPEVYFNYLGSLLVPEVDEFKVAGPYNGRTYTLDKIETQQSSFLITGFIADDQLQMTWQYSTNQYHIETVRYLGRAVMEELRTIIKHLQASEASAAMTPSS